jgi:hypothetical protein
MGPGEAPFLDRANVAQKTGVAIHGPGPIFRGVCVWRRVSMRLPQ